LPVAAIPIMATSSPYYQSYVSKVRDEKSVTKFLVLSHYFCQVIQTANQIYQEFLESEKGLGFSGQVRLFSFVVIGKKNFQKVCQNELLTQQNFKQIKMKLRYGKSWFKTIIY